MTIAWRPGPSGLRLAGIILTAALAFLGEGATYSVLGPYVRDRIGGGDEITGLVLGVGTAAALAARVVVAARVDTGGPRRLMALGVVLASAAGPLYLVASSVPLLLVPRVLAGFGVACAFSAGLAWAVAIAPADRRGQVIGLYGLCVWAGLSLGPVLAAGLRSVGASMPSGLSSRSRRCPASPCCACSARRRGRAGTGAAARSCRAPRSCRARRSHSRRWGRRPSSASRC